jgi:hypothetical protein
MGLDVALHCVGMVFVHMMALWRALLLMTFFLAWEKKQPWFSDAGGRRNVHGGSKAGCPASRTTESGRGLRGMEGEAEWSTERRHAIEKCFIFQHLTSWS